MLTQEFSDVPFHFITAHFLKSSIGVLTGYPEYYRQARIILEDVVKSEPENATAHCYVGMSPLSLNQSDPENAQFQDVIQHRKNAFVEHATWYPGLAALKKRDVNQANMIFGQLKAESQTYIQQANELLNLLEKMQQ